MKKKIQMKRQVGDWASSRYVYMSRPRPWKTRLLVFAFATSFSSRNVAYCKSANTMMMETTTKSEQAARKAGTNFVPNGHDEDAGNIQSCIFSVNYNELSLFQVEFGAILDYDQHGSTSSDIGLCDDCKCSSIGSPTIAASIQGDCHGSTEGIDLLEFTLATEDPGSLEITCPDLRFQMDFECQVWDLVTRSVEAVEDVIAPHSIELVGPAVAFDIDAGYLVKCTAICQNVGRFTDNTANELPMLQNILKEE